MTLKPRFLFRANASSISGRIAKPKDILIDTPASSSLGIVGGRATSRAENGNIADVVKFGSATTTVEGTFDDLKKLIDVLCGRASEDTLTASTMVSSEVRDLFVDAKAPFAAKRIGGGFAAKSSRGSGEPSIKLLPETSIEGASLGGFKLIIDLNTKLFQRFDTLSKLKTAADDPKFVRESGGHLFMKNEVPGRTTASPVGRFVESGPYIYGTIVKSIRWADKPYPGAVIDGNVITIPDCGELYFGELLLSCLSRRLVMLRLRLCCPQPMMMMCSDGDDNGTWGI
ncbi:MAG TPA: hypothetical protein VJP86_10050 [Vicinamibacterales bacterium]|jgi:hypothetical protein|nr:hypothetical protein [Vicinamibacterales bacterium]